MSQKLYSKFKAEQKTYLSKDGQIQYIDKGEGPVIVLLHGVPTSGWLYRHIIDLLVDEGYRVIAPDMLGFGTSDSPKGYDIYSEAQHAERLLGLLNHLNIDHWTHVMHDAGGLWTWELIKKAPDRITKLVILNTIIYEAGFAPPIRFKPGLFAKLAMWSYRNGVTTNLMLKGLFKEGLTENNLSTIDIEGYKAPLLAGKTRAMYYFFSQTCNALPDYTSVIKTLNVPTLVIWGKNDSFLKWEPQSDNVIRDLSIASDNIHLLDAKHFIQEEHPKVISDLIIKFLT